MALFARDIDEPSSATCPWLWSETEQWQFDTGAGRKLTLDTGTVNPSPCPWNNIFKWLWLVSSVSKSRTFQVSITRSINYLYTNRAEWINWSFTDPCKLSVNYRMRPVECGHPLTGREVFLIVINCKAGQVVKKLSQDSLARGISRTRHVSYVTSRTFNRNWVKVMLLEKAVTGEQVLVDCLHSSFLSNCIFDALYGLVDCQNNWARYTFLGVRVTHTRSKCTTVHLQHLQRTLAFELDIWTAFKRHLSWGCDVLLLIQVQLWVGDTWMNRKCRFIRLVNSRFAFQSKRKFVLHLIVHLHSHAVFANENRLSVDYFLSEVLSMASLLLHSWLSISAHGFFSFMQKSLWTSVDVEWTVNGPLSTREWHEYTHALYTLYSWSMDFMVTIFSWINSQQGKLSLTPAHQLWTRNAEFVPFLQPSSWSELH